MDGPPPLTAHAPAPGGFVTLSDPRCAEYILDALKCALHAPGEHRLFRAGKLPGLFPARAGVAADAALHALRDGLLETVRTEAKGRLMTEWVCATPKAVGFVHEHDSPRSILRELKAVLHGGPAGVPAFMAEAKAELAALAANFEASASAVLAHLDDLAKRCEAALRRAEVGGPAVGGAVGRVVPWAVNALEYLDRRSESGARGDCPLPELFHALAAQFPDLTLPTFQDGVKRLHDVRALRLSSASVTPEPEYAVVVEGQLMYAASR